MCKNLTKNEFGFISAVKDIYIIPDGILKCFYNTKTQELQGPFHLNPCQDVAPELAAIGGNVLYAQNSHYLNEAGYFFLQIPCSISEISP